MELDYRAIGVRIRRRRKALGLTQQKLAELSEQEPSNISHIERGATKLSLQTLVSIANVLHASADDLLCASLADSQASYDRGAGEILAGCTLRERIVITETMLALKENLRRQYKGPADP